VKVFIALVALMLAAMAAAGPAPDLGLPKTVDPAALYVIYLHGRIVEEQGVHAVSPEYGPYRFQEILDAIAARGFVVIGEVRPKGMVMADCARRVVQQIEALRARGVPASHITVVGASRGAGIAALVSSMVGDSGVNTVLLAICNPEMEGAWKRDGVCVKGNVLTLYDSRDIVASSCRSFLERCTPTLRDHGEIVVTVGTGHGILYQPLPAWIEPSVAWARAHATGSAPVSDTPSARASR
jgi:hypothetical protein